MSQDCVLIKQTRGWSKCHFSWFELFWDGRYLMFLLRVNNANEADRAKQGGGNWWSVSEATELMANLLEASDVTLPHKKPPRKSLVALPLLLHIYLAPSLFFYTLISPYTFSKSFSSILLLYLLIITQIFHLSVFCLFILSNIMPTKYITFFRTTFLNFYPNSLPPPRITLCLSLSLI